MTRLLGWQVRHLILTTVDPMRSSLLGGPYLSLTYGIVDIPERTAPEELAKEELKGIRDKTCVLYGVMYSVVGLN